MKLALLLVMLCLAGCDQQRRYESQLLSFGTVIEISLFANTQEQAETAIKMAENEFQTMHKNWHAWKPGPLKSLNKQLASGQPARPGVSLLAIISEAKTLSIESGNLFNPAMGQLISAWGFHQDDPENATPPNESVISSLIKKNPSMADLRIDDSTVFSDNHNVQLDFGGFAKGYGLRIIAEKLIASGTENFILNAGGDLVTAGQHTDRPWRIAIRDPDGNAAIAGLQAKNGEAIFTSGDYERYYISDGLKQHHIIDPRTGYPTRNTRAVTVIHDDPALADAAATAIFVAGPALWPKIAADMGIKYVLLLDSEHTIHLSSKMADRIQLSNADNYLISVHP